MGEICPEEDGFVPHIMEEQNIVLIDTPGIQALPMHPEGTSIGSDNCDFFKSFLTSLEVNEISIFWPKNPMNDTSQFREDLKEIYI